MDFVEQLKSSVDIVKVVGEYVRLKKAGAGPRYTGLCPFHTEKTASFSVHQTHQFYKCFGCGAGGDVIKFVMEIERLSFYEALRLLADRNGIPMPKRALVVDEETRLREAAYQMLELAAEKLARQILGDYDAHPQALCLLAEALLRQGQNDAAIHLLEPANERLHQAPVRCAQHAVVEDADVGALLDLHAVRSVIGRIVDQHHPIAADAKAPIGGSFRPVAVRSDVRST